MNNYEDWAQLVAKKLKGEADLISAIEKDELDDAAAAEAFGRAVLRPFLPENFGIGSGRVVDAFGNHSNYQDIVVYNRDFPRIGLRSTNNAYLYESVLATFSIRAKFIRKTFFESLDACASLAQLDTNIDKTVLIKLAKKNGLRPGPNKTFVHDDPLRTARFELIGRPPAFVYGFSGMKNSFRQLQENIELWIENRTKIAVETPMKTLPTVVATQGCFAWRNAAPLALSIREMLGIGNDPAPIRLIVLQLLYLLNRRLNVTSDGYGLKPNLNAYLGQFSAPKFEVGVGNAAEVVNLKKSTITSPTAAAARTRKAERDAKRFEPARDRAAIPKAAASAAAKKQAKSSLKSAAKPKKAPAQAAKVAKQPDATIASKSTVANAAQPGPFSDEIDATIPIRIAETPEAAIPTADRAPEPTAPAASSVEKPETAVASAARAKSAEPATPAAARADSPQAAAPAAARAETPQAAAPAAARADTPQAAAPAAARAETPQAAAPAAARAETPQAAAPAAARAETPQAAAPAAARAETPQAAAPTAARAETPQAATPATRAETPQEAAPAAARAGTPQAAPAAARADTPQAATPAAARADTPQAAAPAAARADTPQAAAPAAARAETPLAATPTAARGEAPQAAAPTLGSAEPPAPAVDSAEPPAPAVEFNKPLPFESAPPPPADSASTNDAAKRPPAPISPLGSTLIPMTEDSTASMPLPDASLIDTTVFEPPDELMKTQPNIDVTQPIGNRPPGEIDEKLASTVIIEPDSAAGTTPEQSPPKPAKPAANASADNTTPQIARTEVMSTVDAKAMLSNPPVDPGDELPADLAKTVIIPPEERNPKEEAAKNSTDAFIARVKKQLSSSKPMFSENDPDFTSTIPQ